MGSIANSNLNVVSLEQ